MRMSDVVRGVSLVSVLVIVGCKTSSLSNLQPVPILGGITDAEALNAVIVASDTAAERTQTRGPIKSYEDGVWTVEDKNEMSVLVSCSLDRRNVSVRYTVEGRVLVPSVVSAMNVRHSSSRIHGNVIVWINRHAADIKSAMWKIKQARTGEKSL